MSSSPSDSSTPRMPHRLLGNSGLMVSNLALGSWMWADDKYTPERWYEMMKVAFKHGADRNMGAAIKMGIADGIWSREDLVVTAKVFGGSKGWFAGGPNDQGASRKHVIEGTKASLARLQLDYVDVIFCHRSETYTPIEEPVRAMNFVIEQGWAFYWGTSQWSTADIIEACEVDRLGLIRPVVEQPEYNLLERSKVELEFAPLIEKYGLGLSTWSPLSFGTLTGKYSAGTPDGSRLDMSGLKGAIPDFEERVIKADRLKPVAEELGCSMAQLAIAWCVSNDKVSTVMIGASSPAQLEQNLKALDVVSKISPKFKAKIEALVPLQAKVPSPAIGCSRTPPVKDTWCFHERLNHL
ncbi:Aldo/keto reductase family [Phytophthora infestans]|uniref:Aldo/keto reductase family n=1 Tax=Phytophthora infestans TaxID=4787 RepID=A0A833WHC7_PHYIN|nr:Aldo/keto reductase family [Phytophthora infestans]KAF4133665.1 Aldo/keto reductase family [Phytophthora infestans]